jgi:Flp pilus assembly CpaF family ATPase
MITEEYKKLKSERKQLKVSLEKEIAKSFEFSFKYEETSKQLSYWKECVSTYETGIKDLISEKTLKETMLSTHKEVIMKLEDYIFQLNKRLSRFYDLCCSKELLSLQEDLSYLRNKSSLMKGGKMKKHSSASSSLLSAASLLSSFKNDLTIDEILKNQQNEEQMISAYNEIFENVLYGIK